MRILTYLFVISALFFSCGEMKEQHGLAVIDRDTMLVDSGNGNPKISEAATNAAVETQKFEVVAFQNAAALGGWGFDIYVDGRRYIHQPTVPVISGTQGFQTREQSERAGGMMVAKLKEGKMPPALDESDLVLLGLK